MATGLPVFECSIVDGEENISFNVRKASYAELLRTADKYKKNPVSNYESTIEMYLKYASHTDGTPFKRPEIEALFERDVDVGAEMTQIIQDKTGFSAVIEKNR